MIFEFESSKEKKNIQERKSYGIAEPPRRPLPRLPLDVFIQLDVLVEGGFHLLQPHVVSEVMMNRHHTVLGADGDLKHKRRVRDFTFLFYILCICGLLSLTTIVKASDKFHRNTGCTLNYLINY